MLAMLGRSDEHLLAWGHAEVAPVMLGEVVTGESSLIGHLDEREPVLEQLARCRTRNVLNVVKNPECWCGCRQVVSLPGRQ